MEFGGDVLFLKAAVGSCDKPLAECVYIFSFNGKSCSKVVSSKIFQKIGIVAQLLEQGEFGDGANRSLPHPIIDGDDNCGAIVLLCDASGDDGDNAGMPFLRRESDSSIA